MPIPKAPRSGSACRDRGGVAAASSVSKRVSRCHPVLAGQAELLFRRLVEFGEFLLSLDHKIAYIGDIGVGKTTAVCRAGRIGDRLGYSKHSQRNDARYRRRPDNAL